MRILIGLLLFLIGYSNIGTAQTRAELEKKRRSVNSQIKKTNKLIKKAATNRRSSLKSLKKLKAEIGSQTNLITHLSERIDTINNSLDRKITAVEALENDLSTLKKNYKRLIRQLYRYKLNQNALSFIFAASSFNEAYQRWIYLKRLKEYRSIQAQLVQKTQHSLTVSINALEAQKAEQNTLLQEELTQKQQLDQAIQDKDKLIVQLQKQERSLRSDLKRKTRYKRQLNKKIENAILQQIAAAKSAARKYQKQKVAASASKATNPILKSVKPASAESLAFAQQKGRLSLPIDRGVIVGRYGRRKHPLFQEVTINNNGIDIKGEATSIVRNIYTGQVVSIFTIPGFNNAIMVKHGDYYTTYSNIAKVYVKKGDRLKTGSALGTIGRDNNAGGYILHFEIWHNKTKENPSHWVR